MNKVLLLCRAGFEKECAAEISDMAAQRQIQGFSRAKENKGYVLFECQQPEEADRLLQSVPFNQLIFARQFMVVGELLRDLPEQDRITPVVAQLTELGTLADDVVVEVPDTNEGRELLKFCRKFTVPLRSVLRKQRIVAAKSRGRGLVIHLLFIAPGCCYVGYNYHNNSSPFAMGIPRLKMPADAPSRSTLKLEEAFHLFIPAREWAERLEGGKRAVDLGAAPGGWTYQLVQRSMMVQAVDNGAMAQSLLDTGQVRHFRADGFSFQPARQQSVYWLVCDMVEQPTRIAALISRWLVNGWCSETIFNLKLPMKKRYQQVCQDLQRIREQLEEHSLWAVIQAKQLYHDREEITVHIRVLGSSKR
ncbi:MAG: 23S rRNA (cytidine(2498)-2'-O)-methyltransferase RlmM [Enterobacteriaceae bacterium]